MQIVNIITQYYPSFFKALGITLQMTVISLLCATVLGVIFGLFKVSDFKVLNLLPMSILTLSAEHPCWCRS